MCSAVVRHAFFESPCSTKLQTIPLYDFDHTFVTRRPRPMCVNTSSPMRTALAARSVPSHMTRSMSPGMHDGAAARKLCSGSTSGLSTAASSQKCCASGNARACVSTARCQWSTDATSRAPAYCAPRERPPAPANRSTVAGPGLCGVGVCTRGAGCMGGGVLGVLRCGAMPGITGRAAPFAAHPVQCHPRPRRAPTPHASTAGAPPGMRGRTTPLCCHPTGPCGAASHPSGVSAHTPPLRALTARIAAPHYRLRHRRGAARPMHFAGDAGSLGACIDRVCAYVYACARTPPRTRPRAKCNCRDAELSTPAWSAFGREKQHP